MTKRYCKENFDLGVSVYGRNVDKVEQSSIVRKTQGRQRGI